MSKSPGWTLIVLRAWVEAEGMRVRMLRTDSAGDEAGAVVASPEDAARIVGRWLGDLAPGSCPGAGGVEH